jgi:uncharacterized membrane protein
MLTTTTTSANARWNASTITWLWFFGGITVLGGTGQLMFLPFWLSTFDGHPNPYFILFFAGLMFNIIFWTACIPGIWNGSITREMMHLKWHPYMAMIGICDALNGFGAVYNSSTTRVSGPLQSILLQSTLIFTVILSKMFLKHKLKFEQWVSVLITLIGVSLGLMPIWIKVASHEGNVNSAGWYYSMFFLLACIPGAGMNVAVEVLQRHWIADTTTIKNKIDTNTNTNNNIIGDGGDGSGSSHGHGHDADGDKPKFSIVYLQAVESLYQFAFFVLFFWLDLVPIFGSSSSLTEWRSNFIGGFTCFFNSSPSVLGAETSRCYLNAAFGIPFMLSYALNYLASGFVTQYGSANWLALTAVLPTIFVNFIWLLFPKWTNWTGGNTDDLSWQWMMAATFLIVFGVFLFNHNKPRDKFDGSSTASAPNTSNSLMSSNISFTYSTFPENNQ